MDGFLPFLLGGSGYPLLSWLMIPHCGHYNPIVLKSLYNRKLWRRRGVVKNAFGILKQRWREFLNKTKLEVAYMLHVINCCAILYNLFLGQTSRDVERLLEFLQGEGWHEESNNEDPNGVVEQAVGNVELGERPWDA
jgi:hypothetical protein